MVAPGVEKKVCQRVFFGTPPPPFPGPAGPMLATLKARGQPSVQTGQLPLVQPPPPGPPSGSPTVNPGALNTNCTMTKAEEIISRPMMALIRTCLARCTFSGSPNEVCQRQPAYIINETATKPSKPSRARMILTTMTRMSVVTRPMSAACSRPKFTGVAVCACAPGNQKGPTAKITKATPANTVQNITDILLFPIHLSLPDM